MPSHRSPPSPPAEKRPWLAVSGAALVVLAFAMLAWLSQAPPVPAAAYVACLAVAWLGYAVAVRHAATIARVAAPLLLAALLCRVAGLWAQPVHEDDWARYLWDGWRLLQAGTPYGTPPAAHFGDASVPVVWQRVLDRINHPDLPTLYAPVLQAVFAASAWLAPANLMVLKLLLLAADGAICALLWRLGGAAAACRWSLCPLVVFEVAFNAHADVVGVAWMLAAAWATARHWRVAAGAALGLALASKAFALLLLPFVWARVGWRAALATVATALAAYAPFAIQAGTELESLLAFAAGWEFNPFGFAVLQWAAGDALARWLWPALAAAFLCLYALHWHRARQPWPPDLAPPLAVLLLLSPVVNAWYLLWLAPWAALRPAAWQFGAMVAVSLAYLTTGVLGLPSAGIHDHPAWLRPLEVAVFLAVVAAGAVAQRRSCSNFT